MIWFIHCSIVWAISILCVSHRVALSNDYARNVDRHLRDSNTFPCDLPNPSYLLTSWVYMIPTRSGAIYGTIWRYRLTRTCIFVLISFAASELPELGKVPSGIGCKDTFYRFNCSFIVRYSDDTSTPICAKTETEPISMSRWWKFPLDFASISKMKNVRSSCQSANARNAQHKQSAVFRSLETSASTTAWAATILCSSPLILLDNL